MTTNASSKDKVRPICVYCGQRPADTRDHVVAGCFFPGDLPSSMITVPSCKKCNQGFKHDEEYVRTLIAMDYTVSESSDSALRQLVGPVTRSFLRPESAGLLNGIIDDSKPVTLVSEGGIYLGKTRAIRMDENRFANVAKKIVRGLYFCETGDRFGSTYSIAVSVVGSDTSGLVEWLEDHPMPWRRSKSIDDRVFRYMWTRLDDDTRRGIWLLEFYESFDMLVYTVSPRDQEELLRRRGEVGDHSLLV